MKRLFIILILFALLAGGSSAPAEAPPLEAAWVTIPGPEGSGISYPVFSGGPSDIINDTILTEAHIAEYEQILGSLTPGSAGLRITCRIYPEDLDAPVVSVVISAKGRMLQGRPSQIWYAFVFDTVSGEKKSLGDMFMDEAAALGIIEEAVLAQEERLSDYMENRDLLPLPTDNFALSPTGITLYYPADQMSTLSGYAGDVTIPYGLLRNVMSFLPEAVTANDMTAEKVLTAAKNGQLYSLPIRIGSDADEVLSLHRCSVDAGYYPDGLTFEMEDSTLLGAILVTDPQGESVRGLIARSISLAGLTTGEATREIIFLTLGIADKSDTIDADEAVRLMLTPGTLDSYVCGEYVLSLNCDADGVLYAATLFGSR